MPAALRKINDSMLWNNSILARGILALISSLTQLFIRQVLAFAAGIFLFDSKSINCYIVPG
jgi:hypothetical protein